MSVIQDFSSLSNDLIEMKLSHVWDGYAGTVFLEFGSLTENKREDGTLGNPKGLISIGIEWSWQLSDKNSIICTSEDPEDTWIPILKKLVGSKPTRLNVVGQPLEIEIAFSSNKVLSSLPEEECEPTWMILDNRSADAHGFEVKNGKLSY